MATRAARILAATLAGSFTLLALAGCGQGGASSSVLPFARDAAVSETSGDSFASWGEQHVSQEQTGDSIPQPKAESHDPSRDQHTRVSTGALVEDASLNPKSAMRRVADEAELAALFAANLPRNGQDVVPASGNRGNFSQWTPQPPVGVVNSPPAPSLPSPPRSETPGSPQQAKPGSAEDWSTTMLQEAGVDESDLVKNDGRYLYVADGAKIHVVDAFPPASMREVSTLKLTNTVVGLYLRSDAEELVVLDSHAALTTEDSPDSWIRISCFDISDPRQPKPRFSRCITGTLAGSRLIASELYLTLHHPARSYSASGRFTSTIENALPITWTGDAGQPERLLNASDVIVPRAGLFSWTLGSLVNIDLDDPDRELETLGILDAVAPHYMSEEAVYFTSSAWQSWQNTFVHKVQFTRAGPVYMGSGVIPGRTIDAYSMSEWQDDLRVATTETWPSFSSAVHVLRAQDGELTIVGALTDIVPGETMTASFFVGARGFLTTVVQRMDPLVTLDLSDPANPRTVGEVELPGWTSRLLPISEELVVGLGNDGVTQRVQLSLFDISDLAHPRVAHQVHLPGYYAFSDAISDAHAMQWFSERGLLGIPASGMTLANVPDPDFGILSPNSNFQSVFVYEIDAATKHLLAKKAVSTRIPWGSVSTVHRAVFLDRFVYGVTNVLLRAADVDDAQATPFELHFER